MKDNKFHIILFIIVAFLLLGSINIYVAVYFFSASIILYGMIFFQILFIIVSFLLIKNNIKLKELCNVDYLTKTYTRKYFFEELEKEFHRFRRDEGLFSLASFDIDNFKNINFEIGHPNADKVLVKLCDVIKNNIRKYDVFGRLGGEEFGIILPKSNEEESLEICKRIKNEINNSFFYGNVKVSISIGLTTVKKGDSPSSLYKRSDNLMFESKKKGKNTITVG